MPQDDRTSPPSLTSEEAADLLARARELLDGALPDESTMPRALRSRATISVDQQPEGLDSYLPAPQIPEEELSGDFGRYRHLALIGVGSMGEVHRVQDVALGRVIAMKVVKPGLQKDSGAVSRFVAEARAIARLDHPGILPIYELGHLPDGRFYFTMQEVKGTTLADVIRKLYSRKLDTRWDDPEWSFRKVVNTFFKTCESVAYAHSKGVIHRDLKPENIIVGRYGEVLVVDWGLAKEWSMAPSTASMSMDLPALQQSTMKTIAGSILGTPAYMSPEQANGQSDLHSPRSDVYSLGAVLYEILAGHPPYVGDYAIEVICMVQDGAPDPLPAEDPMIPQVLRDVCERAMARDPQDRYANAGALLDAVGQWLEQARARERALEVLSNAKRKAQAIERLLQRAEALKSEARTMRRSLGADAPMEAKRPAWRLEDEASNLIQGARVLEATVVQLARSALQILPDLPEAHGYLADYYQSRHEQSEDDKDPAAAAQFAMLLKSHARPRHRRYLDGRGALTLVTLPSEAKVDVFRFVERDRRLVPERYGKTHRTPIQNMELPIGSYLLKVRYAGHLPINYPVQIRREEEWTGIPPLGSKPEPILLPRMDAIGPDEVYVPAGWYISGGDSQAFEGLPRQRVWVDGFVMMKEPVTHQLYLEFLHSLVEQGRHDEVMRYVPRGRTHTGPFARPMYGRGTDGHFHMRGQQTDAFLQAPVVLVNVLCAVMFGYWFSVRTGQRWRLPNESQWEKAARGVDGRLYPWGNTYDSSLCASAQLGEFPTSVDTYPVDVSPYGVRGMGGNAREWCEPHPFLNDERITTTEQNVIPYTARGGCIQDVDCRISSRRPIDPQARSPFVGFRLIRQLKNS